MQKNFQGTVIYLEVSNWKDLFLQENMPNAQEEAWFCIAKQP